MKSCGLIPILQSRAWMGVIAAFPGLHHLFRLFTVCKTEGEGLGDLVTCMVVCDIMIGWIGMY